MHHFVASITILVLMALHAQGTLRCDCKRAKQCIRPTSCPTGYRYDMCNCCEVCAKAEGEVCGGSNYVEGQCGHGMGCIVRDVRSRRNRRKRAVRELIGRCEVFDCHRKRCPTGQVCLMINGGPTCACPKCTDMVTDQVCGEKDGKLYRNECELRTQECLIGEKIGMAPTPCMDKEATHIRCDEESIRIEISKRHLQFNRYDKLSLLDPGCTFTQNDTHITRTTKLDECGTQVMYTLTAVIYSNVVRTVDNPNSIIIRHKSMQVPFECDYSLWSRSRNRRTISTNGNVGKVVKEKRRGNGVGVKIRGRSARAVLTDRRLSVDVDAAERYLVELRAKIVRNPLSKILPTFCYASPIHKAERWMRYTLIENGCPIEDGVEVLPAMSPSIRLTVPNVKFIGSQRDGYLVRCKVKACYASDPVTLSSKCRQQCESSNRVRRASEEDTLLIQKLIRTGEPIRIS